MPFMPLLLPFLRNPWLWVAVAAAVFCFWKGYETGAAKLDRYKAAQFAEATRIDGKRKEVTEKVVTKYIEVKGDTEVVTRTVEKEVIRYENPGYCLDAGWRWLHDAAALNQIPDPARAIDGTGEAPKAAAALSTVTENYATHHQCVDRLDALQSWVRDQEKVR